MRLILTTWQKLHKGNAPSKTSISISIGCLPPMRNTNKLLIMNNIARGGDPHPLSCPNEGNYQQRNDTHDNREASKGHQKPILLHPVAREKSECEREEPSRQTDHGQAITS
jgi:hypothetical protein